MKLGGKPTINSTAESEADAYLSIALRVNARPRVRITHGLVFVNGYSFTPHKSTPSGFGYIDRCQFMHAAIFDL